MTLQLLLVEVSVSFIENHSLVSFIENHQSVDVDYQRRVVDAYFAGIKAPPEPQGGLRM